MPRPGNATQDRDGAARLPLFQIVGRGLRSAGMNLRGANVECARDVDVAKGCRVRNRRVGNIPLRSRRKHIIVGICRARDSDRVPTARHVVRAKVATDIDVVAATAAAAESIIINGRLFLLLLLLVVILGTFGHHSDTPTANFFLARATFTAMRNVRQEAPASHDESAGLFFYRFFFFLLVRDMPKFFFLLYI
jgi:hypothetical protein